MEGGGCYMQEGLRLSWAPLVTGFFLAPLKFYTQNPFGIPGNLDPFIYAPAYHPEDLTGRADNGHPVTPGPGNSGINHKFPQLLGLLHAQWLEPVPLPMAAYGQFAADPGEVKTGDESIIWQPTPFIPFTREGRGKIVRRGFAPLILPSGIRNCGLNPPPRQ